jgi:hypothetical protein
MVFSIFFSGKATMKPRKTAVSIQGDAFTINGQPTYQGRTWNGYQIEGLLMNARLVQGIFDDLNPESCRLWDYPDTGEWDAERNTAEFLAAMPAWRQHGLLGMTLNLQGGSPQGYSKQQPWINSAINADGSLRTEYLARLERILDRADELEMVVILGIFYFGQEKVLNGSDAILQAVDNAVDWVLSHGYLNVMIEIDNESNVRYTQPLLRPERVHELIERAQARTQDGRRLLVGTSFGGGYIPPANVVKVSDFLLIHGNGVGDPHKIVEMVKEVRQVEGYRRMPVLYNEDDHFDFDKPFNNMIAAVSQYAGWGYFDYRMAGEGFAEGYQSVPVDWGIHSERKKGFFQLLQEMTGEQG